jgi:hypothetical protein
MDRWRWASQEIVFAGSGRIAKTSLYRTEVHGRAGSLTSAFWIKFSLKCRVHTVSEVLFASRLMTVYLGSTSKRGRFTGLSKSIGEVVKKTLWFSPGSSNQS